MNEQRSNQPSPWNWLSDGLHPMCRQLGHDWRMKDVTRVNTQTDTTAGRILQGPIIAWRQVCARCGVLLGD